MKNINITSSKDQAEHVDIYNDMKIVLILTFGIFEVVILRQLIMKTRKNPSSALTSFELDPIQDYLGRRQLFQRPDSGGLLKL